MSKLLQDEIYSKFLQKITDYNFASLDANDAYDMMRGQLHCAVGTPYVSKLFSYMTLEDDVLVLDYELKNSSGQNAIDTDFVTNVLAIGMVIEWLEPQVKSVLHTMQMFGGKEEKFYSQSNHLNELRGLLKDCKVEMRKLIRDRGYISNAYINGDT